MPLTLSASERAAFERALSTLLTPQTGTADQWRQDACSALKELLRADYSMYSENTVAALIVRTTDSPLESRTALPRLLGEMTAPTPGQTVMNRLMALERAGKVPVYTTPSLDELLDRRFAETPFHREVMVPGGMRHIAGIVSVAPDGIRRLTVGWNQKRSLVPDERTMVLLRLLRPAFDAGIMHLSNAANDGRFDVVLESAANGMLLLATGGGELHRNAALTRMLSDDPEAGTILVALRATAAAVEAGQFRTARHRGVDVADISCVSVVVRTRRETYAIRARAIVHRGNGDRGEILVTLSPTAAFIASAEDLRQRFGLTGREAEVARLLAARKSDVEIGMQLGISWHTARHHVERVFATLGVRSRQAVADMVIAASING